MQRTHFGQYQLCMLEWLETHPLLLLLLFFSLSLSQIPEQAETFTVVLTAVSGDGNISPLNTEASLVIRQNDDPISFNGSFVEASEGDTVLFTIARGGQANGTCIN